MGESPKCYASAISEHFTHVLAKVRRTRPSCILALTVALLYAKSSMEFRLTLVPMTVDELAPMQARLQQVARSSLHLPTRVPSKCPVFRLHLGQHLEGSCKGPNIAGD